MDVKEAVDFVKAIIPDRNDQGEFTGASAVMVSALSTMIQLASHVQQLSSNSPEMDHVSLGIYGAVRRKGPGGRQRLITLFGPRIEAGELDSTATGEERGSGGAGVGTLVSAHGHTTRLSGIRLPHVSTGNDNRVLGGRRTGEPLERSLRCKAIYTVLEGTGRLGSATVPASVKETYRIPDQVAVKCMSYLLDISGCTSHPRCCRGRDIDNINARRVMSAVKAIFKKYKAIISRTGVDKHKIRYTSLLPDEVKGKEVIIPRIRVSRSRTGLPYIRQGEVKTNLSIAKADRNAKAQNIALIASLLHHREHGVTVEEVLAEYGLKGLGEEGCKFFGGCRLGTPCKDAPKDACLLYNEVDGERKVVGKGSPDPFLTFLLGREIPQSAIAMRVKSISCPVGVESRRNDSFPLPDSWYVWPKCDVGRVEFLGRFNDILGTGILVCKLFPGGDGGGCGDSGDGDNMTDLSDAILLCDVKVAQGSEGARYPFGEWYGNARVKKIRDLQCETPKRLSDILSQSARHMLWSSGSIRDERGT